MAKNDTTILRRLSHTQLSMIASALAVGDWFCCRGRGQENCDTVFDDHELSNWLASYAYEAWGCMPGREPIIKGIDPRSLADGDPLQHHRWACHYFDKFMEII